MMLQSARHLSLKTTGNDYKGWIIFPLLCVKLFEVGHASLRHCIFKLSFPFGLEQNIYINSFLSKQRACTLWLV